MDCLFLSMNVVEGIIHSVRKGSLVRYFPSQGLVRLLATLITLLSWQSWAIYVQHSIVTDLILPLSLLASPLFPHLTKTSCTYLLTNRPNPDAFRCLNRGSITRRNSAGDNTYIPGKRGPGYPYTLGKWGPQLQSPFFQENRDLLLMDIVQHCMMASALSFSHDTGC